ncbi:MAG: SDR family NAD(P)-dependent oxidoreductase [bacterium]|nr:SDR family NAD(P)-dependent oxidoreductase [bacterium]
MGRLQDRVTVVTGGATGIGGATCKMFAEEGAITVVVDYNQAEGEKGVERIRAAGGQAEFHQLDVRSAEDTAQVFQRIGSTHGHIDVLVCSAGVLMGAFQGIEDLQEDAWDATIDTNLKGTFLTTKFAAPWLRRAQHSVMLLIASGAGVRGGSSSYAYAASKAGMHGMQYNFATDLSTTRVHVICPGGIASPLKLLNVAQGATARGDDADAAVNQARKDLGDPVGVARILTFLASDDGDYVRGTIFTR